MGLTENKKFNEFYRLGLKAFDKSLYNEAIDLFISAHQLLPKNISALEMLATSYGNTQQWDKSIQTFEKVIDLGHECANCYKNKALAHERLGQLRETLDSLNTALRIDSSDSTVWFRRGLLIGGFLGISDFDDGEINYESQHEAFTSFVQARELDPFFYEAWLFNGIALFNLEMLLSFHRGFGIEASNTENFFDASLRALNKAIEINPSDIRGWQYKGKLLTELHSDYDQKAVEVYKKIAELDAENADGWYQLAILQGNLNLKEDMLESLKITLELDPEYKEEIEFDFEKHKADKDFEELLK